MRMAVLWLAVAAALLDSDGLNAQVDWQPTPAPQISALAAWQVQADPIFYAGDFYDASGPNVFFDGNVMVRTGAFRDVALYTDTTRQPFSVILAPIGRSLMRPYERRPAAALVPVGTGGRIPALLTDRDGHVAVAGEDRDSLSDTVSSTASTAHAIESIPRPDSNSGVWIEFDDARWYSAGSAVVHTPDRFTQVGSYSGIPVYQLRSGARDVIYVPSVLDGPLAPYRRR
jgi:hypothetical protein